MLYYKIDNSSLWRNTYVKGNFTQTKAIVIIYYTEPITVEPLNVDTLKSGDPV